MGWEDGEFDDPYAQYDDVQIGAAVADNKPMEKFDEDMEMGPPPGPRTLCIKGMKLGPIKDGELIEKGYDCYLDGEKEFYTTHTMEVELYWKENPSKTIRDFFVLPPGMGLDPSRAKEVALYMKATSKNVAPNGNNVGFHWKKVKNLLGHIGLPVSDDGSIPPFTGRSFRFWPDGVPRDVASIVEVQKTDPNKPDAPRYKQVKICSYKDSEFTLLRKLNPSASAPSSNGSEKAKELSKIVDEVDVDL